MNVCLNGKMIECLWDTGSMISLINKEILDKQFPGVEIHSIEDFLENQSLTLTAANNSEVKVDGVVVLTFGVEESSEPSSASLFQVPFLVTSENVSKPIIGYNIIEHFVTRCKSDFDVPNSLVKIIKNLTLEKAESMVNVIESGEEISEISSEVILQKTEKVEPGCMRKLRCKVKKPKYSSCANKLILFSPYEELCLENDLVIFEVPEILKMGKKVMQIYVYNPTTAESLLLRGRRWDKCLMLRQRSRYPFSRKNKVWARSTKLR